VDESENVKMDLKVGERLHCLRDEKAISMRALARLSGLSANALSMIERGLASPSVSTLHKLANALEVPITAFFQREHTRNRIVFRKDAERVRLPFPNGVWEGLGGEAFIGQVEPFMLTLEAGGDSGQHGMIHSGHEFVYCLDGTLEYDVDGQRFMLESGDSLIFAARLIHSWRNPGPLPTHAIILISGFEERDHPGQLHRTSASSEEGPGDDPALL
jgi:transcriptional regulator with XRE-family HTH domain